MHNQLLAPSKPLAIRWLLLIAILSVELVVITTQYEAPRHLSSGLTSDTGWSALLFQFSKQIWALSLWIIVSCFLILSPRLKIIFNDFVEQSSKHRWLKSLLFHFLALVVFAVITSLIFATPDNPDRFSAPWFTVWFALASATLLLWLLALAPGNFWLQLIRQERIALVVGCLLGICAWWIVIGMRVLETVPIGVNQSWDFVSVPTMHIVRYLLGWVYSDIVYEPEIYLLGTTAFKVEIGYSCSGITGVSMITLFLVIYLWLFRKEYRFPQALWLFPLGITVIWLANAVRIAMLIAIGASYSPDIAMKGFHSQAGWIAFTLIAVAAISLSKRITYFTVTKQDQPVVRIRQSLAGALIVPLLALMAASMVTSAFSSGFDLLYPLRVIVIAIILWYFRKAYMGLGWQFSWEAPAIGIAVFIIWMLMEPNVDSSKTVLYQGLAELSSVPATIWLVFRVIGSVITVPLAEELAFRGYLIRKLISKDFESVPLNRFTWISFVISSVLFGLLHDRWIAGTIAGMFYAWALYRRGHIGDPVIAHMTTNALIAVFVLVQGRWSLW